MPYQAKNEVLRCKNLPMEDGWVGFLWIGWFSLVLWSWVFGGDFLRVGDVLKELLKITVFVAALAQEIKSQNQEK